MANASFKFLLLECGEGFLHSGVRNSRGSDMTIRTKTARMAVNQVPGGRRRLVVLRHQQRQLYIIESGNRCSKGFKEKHQHSA